MKFKLILILLVVVVLFTLATLVSAASNAFSLTWWTVDGGGGSSQGGDYALSGTIGQPDTSPRMSAGDFSLVGGFWGVARSAAPPVPPTETPGGSIFLPLLSR